MNQEETKRKPFEPLYNEEEKAFFIEVMMKYLDRRGKVAYTNAVKEIEEKRPGLLKAKDTKNKAIFLGGLWKKRGPQAKMKKQFDDRIADINQEVKREDLVGMIKLKAQEFMLSDYDNLKPSDKLKIVSEAIRSDYNEEKLRLEKDKLRANKRMMDSLMGSLMSGDRDAILSKYQIQLTSPKNLITVVEEDNGAVTEPTREG